MTVLESINRDLAELDTKSLVKAAGYIRSLLPESALQKRVEAIEALHGCLEGEEHDGFEEAVLGASTELVKSN